jgi:hypothetical protein
MSLVESRYPDAILARDWHERGAMATPRVLRFKRPALRPEPPCGHAPDRGREGPRGCARSRPPSRSLPRPGQAVAGGGEPRGELRHRKLCRPPMAMPVPIAFPVLAPVARKIAASTTPTMKAPNATGILFSRSFMCRIAYAVYARQAPNSWSLGKLSVRARQSASRVDRAEAHQSF